jgi:hypothetical protein
LARLLPIDIRPPAPMPPAAMRRSKKIQMPKKISAGSTQDSSVVKKF